MSIYFVLYGRASCKYCEKAKQLLSDLKVPYTYYDALSSPEWFQTFKPILVEKPKSIPLVFRGSPTDALPDINNIDSFRTWTFIGSYFDLEEYMDNLSTDLTSDY
jgi:glutaredoxin